MWCVRLSLAVLLSSAGSAELSPNGTEGSKNHSETQDLRPPPQIQDQQNGTSNRSALADGHFSNQLGFSGKTPQVTPITCGPGPPQSCSDLLGPPQSCSERWFCRCGQSGGWRCSPPLLQISLGCESSAWSRRRSPGSSGARSPGLTPGLGRCPSSSPPCPPVVAPSSAHSGSSLLPTASKGQVSSGLRSLGAEGPDV